MPLTACECKHLRISFVPSFRRRIQERFKGLLFLEVIRRRAGHVPNWKWQLTCIEPILVSLVETSLFRTQSVDEVLISHVCVVEAYRDLAAFSNENKSLRRVCVVRGTPLVDNDLEAQWSVLKVLLIRVDLDERALVFPFPLEFVIERVGDDSSNADWSKSI